MLEEPDLRTYNIDPDRIEEQISSKAGEVLSVHLYDQICEMDRITEICHRHGLKVFEVCTQAHGAHLRQT